MILSEKSDAAGAMDGAGDPSHLQSDELLQNDEVLRTFPIGSGEAAVCD